MMIAEEGVDGAPEALTAFLEEYETVTVQLDWAVHIPEAIEARQLLARLQSEGSGVIESAVEDAQLASCENLVELESPASQGEMSGEQMECLELRLLREPLQTTRIKISLVLIINAQRAGEQDAWERLVSRHLEDFDRSDPNLCFAYAVHLHRAGVDSAEEAIRWADVALENKQVWPAGPYKKNVYALFKLRADAANGLWQSAATRYAEDNSRENESLSNEFKSQSMSMSREWLDYARASKMSSERALQMCASAAGTIDACR
jgi:hypothetical protein